MKIILKWTGIVFGGLIGLVLLAGLVLYFIGMEKLTRSYPGIPVETITVSTGPDAIARGKHIAIVWACAECHGADMSGTVIVDDPMMGTVPAPNLTTGTGGIGKSYTDADWVRAIRHGVKPNGQVEVIMLDYYANMSDQDLGALITYLKQIPPVDTNHPARHFGPMPAIGTVAGMLSLPMAEVIDHNAPRPADVTLSATKEYGKYLSALCAECHGKDLAGKPEYSELAVNLTSGGELGKWKQEDFVRAVRTGVLPNGKQLSPAMPLKTYSEMNDIELAALWLYLQSLPPVKSQK